MGGQGIERSDDDDDVWVGEVRGCQEGGVYTSRLGGVFIAISSHMWLPSLPNISVPLHIGAIRYVRPMHKHSSARAGAPSANRFLPS